MRQHLVLLVLTTSCTSAKPATADAPPGSNHIAGMVGMAAFSSVGASYWIGSPDSPSTDTVLYIFDAAVECNGIQQPGWDTMLAIGTQILELKLVGRAPATFPMTTAASHIPASGEAAASYTVAAATASDQIATGGMVTLSSLESPGSGHFASGTFQVSFANGNIEGAFVAPFCAGGQEP